jgi:hypothetical protein
MDDRREYATNTEAFDWVFLHAPPKIREAMERIRDSHDMAVREIQRLQGVVREHADALRRPVFEHFEASAMMPNPDDIIPETTIRFQPIALSLRLPFDFHHWSRTHQSAFTQSISKSIAGQTADLLAEKLWPKAT